eukprot:g1723.t1
MNTSGAGPLLLASPKIVHENSSVENFYVVHPTSCEYEKGDDAPIEAVQLTEFLKQAANGLHDPAHRINAKQPRAVNAGSSPPSDSDCSSDASSDNEEESARLETTVRTKGDREPPQFVKIVRKRRRELYQLGDLMQVLFEPDPSETELAGWCVGRSLARGTEHVFRVENTKPVQADAIPASATQMAALLATVYGGAPPAQLVPSSSCCSMETVTDGRQGQPFPNSLSEHLHLSKKESRARQQREKKWLLRIRSVVNTDEKELARLRERRPFRCTYLLGIDNDTQFRVVQRVLGHNSYMLYTLERAAGTGVKLRLRGRGANNYDEREKRDPLQICAITATKDAYVNLQRVMHAFLRQLYGEWYNLTGRRLSPRVLEHPDNPYFVYSAKAVTTAGGW